MNDPTRKLALVTGGLRRLGAHISGRLAEGGYALALHGHSDANPDDSLAETLGAHDSQWSGFVTDFSQDGAAGALLDAVIGHFGRAPDLVVNNASLFDYDDAGTLDEGSLEKHLKINMMVPTVLTTALTSRLSDGERAAVVNIVDQRVRNPNGDQLSYTLSKQALAESIRTLAMACSDKLRVNGVAPGLTIPTDEYEDDQMERLTALMPLGRLSSPDDIAQAVCYLAEAKSITGQTLFVDGGAHMTSFDRDFIFMEQR
ncbi:SDR family oxidoreductase [Parasphingorhabdus cellanae]|uniref:SDR family oxidoreductase n=1 Tax=Parasphingorhabdus cellanae TaxID=2806553 RepID=A0ABX7T494_9SPHN|nr:SDR family oxidoreductase [Parasphingorhabdus cellanae]QTD55319.1 SDR family oxidoreductase [Parasphingorhabdus cellanae]